MNRFEFDVMPAAAHRVLRRISRAEIMIAAAIVGGASLALGRFAGPVTDSLSVTEQRVMAAELAAERLHATRVAGAHADTMATLESTIPGYPGFSRVTAVRRVGGGARDSVRYRVVTTTVLASGLASPIRKTAIIRAE
jgi:hypothetical protein